MKNPFLKHIMKARKEDVVHSSTYASAQNKDIGTASVSTFSDRQRIDQNRSVVQNYRDAKIIHDSAKYGPKPKIYTENSTEDTATQSIKQRLNDASRATPVASSTTESKKTYAPEIKPNIKPKI